MQFHKIMEERKSVREFKEKRLAKTEVFELLEFCKTIDHLVENIGSSFHFIEEGEKVYNHLEGNAGYHGMNIKAPHYLVLVSEVKESHLENTGYIMEQVLLKAFQMEIGSCWLDIIENQGDLKEKLGIVQQGEIVALAALGYPKSNIFGMETSVSERYSIEEMVYLREWGQFMSVEELQQRGLDEVFYYVRHAPSWGNTQPWKFIIDEGKLLLTMLKENPYIEKQSKNSNHKLDCGIIMLYIERMMHKQGIRGYWNLKVEELNQQKQKYHMPDERVIMGWYAL